ncbi:tyrosine-type recombinase/integrase [Rhizobium sp. P28RR-XV]|uniref:tyrosine-type recombinase/integrase n=1 Tax=Rhizobium sp. P28RR-XV TaxID=2726737 RepID=UPI001456A897|nr:site-specific integrase [Rhizobium sp. P28RR-XV]NLR88638.1 tyrosine-type recombinase/integrase [Rhizobium sp. P28RR-XV]
MAKALTVKSIEALKPEASRKEIPDGGMPGLYLILQPKKVRDGKELPPSISWAVRYRFDGKPKKHTIGPYPAYGLSEARKAAGAALRAVSEGRDPASEKKFAKHARTADQNLIENVLNDFVTRHVEAKNRDSSAKESKRIIESEIKPRWKGRQIQTITRREVISLLDDIADRGAPVMANRVLSLLRKFFNWALERDVVQTSPVVNVKAPAAETSRDRVLANNELRLVWKAADKIGWPFGTMTKLLILTAQRREEVSAGHRSEFHLHDNPSEWIIPKERAKNKNGHTVPLVDDAVTIISKMPVIENSKFLFTTNGETSISGFSKAKLQLDREMLTIAQSEAKERGEDAEAVILQPWRFHDLRRTAASGMASLGFPVHVVEAVLNHKSGTIKGVAKVYNRYEYADEKRRALNAWANLVATIVEDRSGTNIIPLKKA